MYDSKRMARAPCRRSGTVALSLAQDYRRAELALRSTDLNTLQDIVAANRNGWPRGIHSIRGAHPAVPEAAVRQGVKMRVTGRYARARAGCEPPA